MKTLQAKDISLAFGDRQILDEISLTLQEGSVSALAGSNGSGKTTLMKILAHTIDYDSGSIAVTKGLRVSYLPQTGIIHRGSTLKEEVLKGFDHYRPLLDDIRRLEEKLSDASLDTSHESDLIELHQKQELLLSGTYYRRDAVIEQVIKGLGFTENDLERRCEHFSGGWQMRIALAKILVEESDVLLLDEPTNYLDIESRIWLRNYINRFRGAVLIVSHDQDFLDETVREVYELFNGHLNRYKGNYSRYVQIRLAEIEQLTKEAERQKKEREKTEKFIERFRYKDSKAKQVQSRVKMLEKIQEIEIPPHLKNMNISFPPPPHAPSVLFTVQELSKRYGDLSVFNGLSFYINRGDRLAITGQNGAGKTTLMNLLSGADTAYEGSIRIGEGVKIGYYTQENEKTLNNDNTVYQEIESSASTGDIPRLRNLLGAFLFSNDDIDKKVGVLSGGERSRLALLKILLHPANVLMLDEPTNHLDINTKQMLLNALEEYQGTVICVSHDTHFIKQLSQRIIYISDRQMELFEGDYEYFSWKLEQKEAYESLESNEQTSQASATREGEKQAPIERKEYNRLKNRMQNLTRQQQELLERIESIEGKIEEVTGQMSRIENYSVAERITELVAKKDELQEQKEELEFQWLEIAQEIEDIEEAIL
ncbi:MAG: ABC-F family ATP-binding cassette domain-containing protein [Sphaerochaetaceae bacterium]|nr:ABC-F family ATP-binding cassette domain-containing protein [Sphaerochaetaceae bacterium]